MKPHVHLLPVLALVASLTGRAAATPPAERLLPPDTLALLSVPDWGRVHTEAKANPMHRLWNDEALRPFREKLLNKLQTEVLTPLEQKSGVKLADYAELLQGQLTLAITRNGWTGTPDPLPGVVLILDTRDKGDQLKTKLAELRQKLTDAGHALKSQEIRGTTFTTLPTSLVPGAEAAGAASGNPPTLAFGQVGSVLVAGLSPRDLERVVGQLGGASMPHLAEEAPFSADYQSFFREADVFGWIHASPLIEVVIQAATAGASGAEAGAFAPRPDKLITALGLRGLKTLAFGIRETTEGSFVDLNLAAPAAERKGLLRFLATEAKTAGAPAFVPADAVGFWRWRLDGQKLWASLEATLEEIQPGLVAGVVGFLDATMKEKEPSFDFKRNFIANLGDDLVGYQKAPRSLEPKALANQPALVMIGSANADQLLGALRQALPLLPEPFSTTPLKEREFLGRRIYSLSLGEGSGSDAVAEFHFSTSGGYALLANEPAIVEEYLRSSEVRPKPLSGTPGLAEAAQKIGGTETGLFGFQNDLEQLKPYWQALRANPGLFFDVAAAQNPDVEGLLGGDRSEIEKAIADWADFKLLPEFEKVARYFHFTIYAGQTSSAGYTLRTFSPLPPGLRN